MNFVFDVDGTLTPSREKIDPEFEKFFLDFCSNNRVYLVTGSDYAKTLEQVGEKVCRSVKGIFNCSGNVYTRRGVEIYRNDFTLTDDEQQQLENELNRSGFSVRTGNHIEKRIGMVNFSIVGRNATKAEREQYKIWDENMNERAAICHRLNEMFTRLECVVGGETGIDISLRGNNKSQIRGWLPVDTLVFFGDRCEFGGNDYPLARVSDIVYHVSDWRETWKILKENHDTSF